MSDSHSYKLGSRIRKLREDAGLTQQDLADKLKLSRPVIISIENDKRALTIPEASTIADFFRLSLTELLDPSADIEVTLPQTKPSKQKKLTSIERINVPQQKLEKFKEVLLYILERVGAKPNVGETVLYKLLYFIDFDFYELYEEQFIGATYIKNTYGPTPIEFRKIVDQMIENGEVEQVKSQYFKKPQRKHLPRRTADLSELSARELHVIDTVLDRLSHMSATAISDYSHKDVPWVITPDKAPIEYESVFYRTPGFSVRDYQDDENTDVPRD
jgi:transcriptional regulator with XRE-family HTH domain